MAAKRQGLTTNYFSNQSSELIDFPTNVKVRFRAKNILKSSYFISRAFVLFPCFVVSMFLHC